MGSAAVSAAIEWLDMPIVSMEALKRRAAHGSPWRLSFARQLFIEIPRVSG
jgi:hypothetical protein